MNSSSIRLCFTTGVATLGVTALVAAPVIAPPPPTVPALPPMSTTDIQLSATVFDILTLPVFRQYVINTVDDVLTLAAGLGESGVGIVDAIVGFPESFVEVTRQILQGDLLGALTTIEEGLVTTSAAVILPTLEAIIERRERFLEVQVALQVAVPAAFVEVGTALFVAGDGIARSTIIGIQALVDAVLTFDLGNIVDAVVDGTAGFLNAVGDGTQEIIDGIYAAQQTLAVALGAPPPEAESAAKAAFQAPLDEIPQGAEFAALSTVSGQEGGDDPAPSDEPVDSTPAPSDDDTEVDDEVDDEQSGGVEAIDEDLEADLDEDTGLDDTELVEDTGTTPEPEEETEPEATAIDGPTSEPEPRSEPQTTEDD